MTSRERTLMALNHQEADMVPVCLAYERPDEILKMYEKEPGKIDMRQDIHMVYLKQPPPPSGVKERYLGNIPSEASIDAWGVARWGSSTGESHRVLGPLRNMKSIKELEEYPFPDVGANTYAVDLPQEIAELHSAGFAVQGAMSQTIFELAWHLYGMENLLVSFYDNAKFVKCLFDRITERRKTMALQFIKAGVDIIRLGDDVGTQNGMMIAPEIWRIFLKPRLAEVISAAREERSDIPIFYHSDGDITKIIEDLIEVGVTILNPVQPECLDPFAIKEKYGKRLTLWGTIGTQTAFPFATPGKMRCIVKEYIERLAPGGGYVIGPTHGLQKDVPWENIAAFYNAVEEFGNYKG